MSDDELVARNRWEALLYLRATPCPSCRRGPLKASSADDSPDETIANLQTPTASDNRLRIDAVCAACSATSTWTFTLREPMERSGENNAGSADAPSSLLDVGQWIMLSGLLVEDALHEREKVRARNLKIEAAACLEEALKFYDDGNDLPPQTALVTDASRMRFRQAPEHFSRQRLIEKHAKLPNPDARTQSSGKTMSQDEDQS